MALEIDIESRIFGSSGVAQNIFVLYHRVFRIILAGSCLFPNQLAGKALLSKNFIEYLARIGHFVFSDGDKNETLCGKYVSGQDESGKHHRQPLRVPFCIASGTHLAAQTIVIAVDKVLAGIIRRVDIDDVKEFPAVGKPLQNRKVICRNNRVVRVAGCAERGITRETSAQRRSGSCSGSLFTWPY